MKTAKHILCMFLSLCLLAGIIPTTVITAKAEGSGTNGELIWDGSVADSYARGSGTSADPFIIETAEQLAKVAYQTSNGEAASSVYYKLADNIYLNDTTDWQSWETAAPQNTWMPIGSSTTAFSGYFDGAGYSIYGVYISTDENYQGLFGSVAGSRSITNLGVEESYIKGGDYVGGICGNSVSDITACHNCSTVIGGTYVGGIAGNIANPGGLFGGSSVNINNCYNTGGVNGTSYVGGVIGNADTGCLSGCYNIGTISGSSYVGGIAGRSLTCSGSWNAGNVTGTTYVGGVLGEATYFGASSSNVTSSFNAGQISGQSYVGGVVGRVRVYSGFYESYLNNCYNIGSIYADGEYAAGIVGGPNCTIVTNCYNVGSCFFSSSSNTSPVFNTGARTGTGNLYFLAGCCGEDYTNIWSNYVTEKSSDEMQASDFVTALGSSWKEDTGGYNHGYPILRAIDYDAYAYYTQSSYDGDSYIIDRVRSYTSDEIYAQYHDIMNSEESDDTKALRLYDLFYNNGLINVREGVLYLSYVPTDRLHYIQLTDNSIYTAYGYYNWLYNTPRGTIERGLLFVDGLIFNNEISTWLNPLTYVGETDLPGVKKYKDMLYNFMDYSSTEIENMQYVSTVMDIAENCTDIGKTYANNLISQINNCSSREERQRLMRSADAIGVYQDVKNEGTDLASYKLTFTLSENSGFGQFAKAVGVVADGFSVIDMTIDHVIDLMDLNSKLAVYNEYRTFLQDIASSSDLPWEMSLAAYNILQEIDNGAWGKIKDIAMDIITVMGMFDSGFKGVGFLKDNFLNIVLGETVAANFNEFLTVIKLEAWCINQIVDIGAVVREVACIVGYAQLGMHYVNKLEASKTQFLANKTADNAWDFYENYSLLYQIRHKGEEAVKELFKVDGFSSIFFDMKHKGAQDALDNIIEILEECQFTLDEKVDVPSSVKYVAKSVVSCPVNVEIYAPNGDYITTLVDGQESDISNEYGRFAVVHRVYSDEYVKVICMSQEGDYKIKVIGVDQGLINFEFAYDNNDVIEEYRFDNVEIAADSVIETSVEQVSSTQTYDMDFDGDGEIDDSGSIRTLSENSYTTVTGLLLNKSSLSMLKGESDLLTISITPNDATTQSVYWLSSNSDVAKVVDGKIIALSTGTATISCISQDNEDALATCTVTVNEPTYAVTVTNGSGSGSYAEGASVTITANVPATGKQFKEWTGADGLTFTSGSKSTATATFTMPTRAVSVTATYEDIPSTTYTITFDPNGGSITTTNATTDVTGKLSALPTPTRSRYSFNGWYTVSSGGVQVTTDTVFNSNTTIYAQWTYTGGGSGGGGGGDNTVSNTNPPSNSQTTRNSDGSTTTTTTRTVTNPDGTVTTTVTTETELMDGTTATIVTDGDGNWVSAETTVSQAALDKALADGKPIQVPITAGPVSAEHTDLAGVITLNLPGFKSDANGNGTVHVSEMPRVEIPLTESGAGIVAMLCDVDGGLTIIKECYEGSIIFPVEKSCDVIIVDNTKSFSDVAGESWYAGDVVFVAAREIFNGVGDGLFSPTSTMSRAMTAQVLYNLDRSSTAGIDSEFSDVKSSDWYADAVGWASKNAIINGYGDSYSATYAITRQDLVTILYRYAKGAGYDVSAAANLGDFIDGNSVADYAQEAMRWAINLGIIGGYEDETIRPTSSATRAEVAAIMTRFVRNAK